VGADHASAAVAEAKAFAGDLAVSAANEIFALGGSRSVDLRRGLDCHWRNARTHTVHDPNRWSYHSAGYYAVHGNLPRSESHGGVAARPAGAAR
jgi:hypothetical protein